MRSLFHKAKAGKTVSKLTSVVLISGVVTSTLSACNKTQEVPELIKPITVPESYVNVKIGDVGKTINSIGTVVPKFRSVYPHSAVAVEKLYAKVGDEVKEGDVLASGVSMLDDNSIESINSRINLLNSDIGCHRRMGNIQSQIFDLQIKLNSLTGQEDQNDALRTSKRMYQVNNDYSITNMSKTVKNLEKQKKEMREDINKLEIKAPISGRIIYARNIATDYMTTADDALFIIADESEKYVEIYNVDQAVVNMDERTAYYMHNGEKTKLNPVEYTKEENSKMRIKDHYPALLYKCELPDAKIGDQIPVIIEANTRKTNVLTVDNTAINYEGNDAYVYVKTDSGTEKRFITIGSADDIDSEVKDGLKENDKVLIYFNQNAPQSYNEIKAEYSDFQAKQSSEKLYRVVKSSSAVAATDDLKVKDTVSHSGYLSAGTELILADYSPKESAVLEAKYALESLRRGHSEAVSDINKSLADLEKATYPKELSEDAVKVMKQLNSLQAEMLRLQRQSENASFAAEEKSLSEQYNKLKKLAKDKEVSIQAETDSKIELLVRKDDSVAKGTIMYSSIDYTEDSIGIFGDDSLITIPLYREAELVPKEGKDLPVLKGKIIGYGGGSGHCYVTTEDENVYVTTAAPAYGSNSQKILVDFDTDCIGDSVLEDYKGTYTEIDVNGIISLPTECVFWEESTNIDNQKQYKPYVWKKTDEGLVQTYVELFKSPVITEKIWVIKGVSAGETILQPTGAEAGHTNRQEDYSGKFEAKK